MIPEFRCLFGVIGEDDDGCRLRGRVEDPGSEACGLSGARDVQSPGRGPGMDVCGRTGVDECRRAVLDPLLQTTGVEFLELSECAEE